MTSACPRRTEQELADRERETRQPNQPDASNIQGLVERQQPIDTFAQRVLIHATSGDEDC
jgi:hypothetical protein